MKTYGQLFNGYLKLQRVYQSLTEAERMGLNARLKRKRILWYKVRLTAMEMSIERKLENRHYECKQLGI